MAEDVVDHAKLIDDAAFGAAQKRMRRLARERRERHRAVLPKLGAQLGCVVIGVIVVADVVDANAETAPRRSRSDDLVQPCGFTLQCPVGLPDGARRGRRFAGEPVGDLIGGVGA